MYTIKQPNRIIFGKNSVNSFQFKEQNSAEYSHAEQLIFFIKEVIGKANISLKEIDNNFLKIIP